MLNKRDVKLICGAVILPFVVYSICLYWMRSNSTFFEFRHLNLLDDVAIAHIMSITLSFSIGAICLFNIKFRNMFVKVVACFLYWIIISHLMFLYSFLFFGRVFW